MSEHFTKEKRILVAMRKTLGAIIKDVTPSSSAFKSPLSDATVEDVRMCFGLIAAREKEIAKEAGVEITDRPHFTDDPVANNVVSIASLKATLPRSNTTKSNTNPKKDESGAESKEPNNADNSEKTTEKTTNGNSTDG